MATTDVMMWQVKGHRVKRRFEHVAIFKVFGFLAAVAAVWSAAELVLRPYPEKSGNTT